ncbi:Gfo/Idh/MocA family oxidoreductase [Alteraurantiacibacter aestuarii]|uniref:Gfo/Idh/MocA family oxidoreductase n=1 Tax=Alteraurantiacibacter aestuarii TaxID=650004 RepID=A0A844ZK82_9SPHN|nr:Gfo/Idh/MocA family oxidoreductase [Alteraurantiacibacter aestuarii]MXO88188.1 gfo/Idh/MocA family oxidoreductase [Alteraurantiacibacter aestuarii]
MSDTSKTGLSRREILAAGATIPLALSAGKAMAQQAQGQPLIGDPQLPLPASERMRWAIVGLGTFAIGQVIPGFGNSSLSRITSFVSGNAAKAHDLGARYGVSRFYDYSNFDAIADDPEIDCVYIVLPVGLHAEFTIRALRAGKHVLCEKPMASTSAECAAMIAAAQAANRQLGVAYRVHFEPNNRDALRRIEAGELGAMRYISADHGFSADPNWPPHKWRLEKALGGGGSMYDIGIYGLNTSLMMLPGDVPQSVSALYSTPAGDPRFTEVEGGIDYRVRMASGINIQGSSSYCWSPYVSRQRYFGATASIAMQPATTYDDNRITLEGGGGPSRSFTSGDPMSQFSAQVDGFSAAARANRPHLTPGEMGLRDMRLIEAMYASADQDGAIIAV